MAQAEQTAVKQSRLGKQPITLPKGVEFSVEGDSYRVKGPKGNLEQSLPTGIAISLDDNVLTVTISDASVEKASMFQGLTRALLANMVTGVSEGYTRSLDLHGVGYRAEVKGRDLLLNVGLSHQVRYTLPETVEGKIETIDEGGLKRPRIHLNSCSKELVGQAAARIRSFRPPEPYKGKGIRYTGEQLRMKAGKAGGKGK